MKHKVKDYFLKYVTYDTQSAEDSSSYPSTSKQLVLLNYLRKQLEQLGAESPKIDEYGYVTATIPATSNKENIPTLLLAAHVDTALEVTGANVKPHVIPNYSGNDITLPGDSSQIIRTSENPYLTNLIGHTIITSDGTTLLGADNKSGVAVIMDIVRILVKTPQIKHGEIKILFNPDEEIGKGIEFLDVTSLGAEFGYTLDASDRGEIQYENFNAKSIIIDFLGKSIHPGYAKNVMIHASKVTAQFISKLPKELSPEYTEGYEGFYHITSLHGGAEKVTLKGILRDFDQEKLNQIENVIRELAERTAQECNASVRIKVKDQYKNMFEKIKEDMRVVDYAKEAMQNLGISPITEPIRGGTDGAQITYKGIPCPNIFTGQQNYHGKQEYISVQDMEMSVKTVIEICRVWEQHS